MYTIHIFIHNMKTLELKIAETIYLSERQLVIMFKCRDIS